GNTKTMAETIAGAAREDGAEVRLRAVADASNDDLVWADGILVGSPVYFGLPAGELVKFIDDSVSVRGQLENTVGAAFVSSGHRAGGRETTIMALLKALLVHGMVVCGDPITCGGHFGAVATGTPDDQALQECRGLAKKVVTLARKLHSGQRAFAQCKTDRAGVSRRETHYRRTQRHDCL
ncbi:MAG: flavodoxin family protein, partial [Halobacteriota archaeon]